MTSNIENNAAKLITKSIKKYIKRKPTLYFYDNDSSNFIDCPNNIVMIKTHETPEYIFSKMTKSKMPLGLITLYDEAVEIKLIYEKTRFDTLVNTIETLGKNYIENLIFKIELNQEELKKKQDSDLKRWICYDYSIVNHIK